MGIPKVVAVYRKRVQMIVKILVENYEIIKKVAIVCEGLTGIVGESHNGKSSLFRAINGLATNSSGKDDIKMGESYAKVGLIFEEDNKDRLKIIWHKGASASYRMNEMVFKKTGRSLPEEIQQVLKMNPLELDDRTISLNFLFQLESPMLETVSGTKLYSLIVKSLDGDKLTDCIKQAKQDIDDLKVLLRDLNVKRDVYQTSYRKVESKLKNYEPLVKLRDEANKIYLDSKKLDKILELKDKIETIEMSVSTMDYGLKQLEPLDKINTAFSKVLVKDQLRADLVSFRARLFNSNRDIKATQQELIRYDKVDELVVLSSKLIKLENKRDLLSDYCIRFSRFSNELSEMSNSYDFCDDQSLYYKQLLNAVQIQSSLKSIKVNQDRISIDLKEVVDELNRIKKDIKANICPICGQEMKENSMDLELIKEKIDGLNSKKQRLEGQMQELKKQEQIVLKEIKAAGYTPSTLGTSIKELEQKIDSFKERITTRLDKLDEVLEDEERDF